LLLLLFRFIVSTNMSSAQRKVRKFALMKRMVTPNDTRMHVRRDETHAHEREESHALDQPRGVVVARQKRDAAEAAQGVKKRRRVVSGDDNNNDGDDNDKTVDSSAVVRAAPLLSGMFFSHNTQLGPPYHVLVDTNFINFSIQNKLDIFQSLLDCLYAKCTAYLSECVVAELERLGPRYRVALRIARDPRFKSLKCTHRGTYADDCLVERVTMHRCYIVATCDKDLRRRLRKIPGVPIMYIHKKRFTVERMPDAFGAPK
jgi:U3 small nucleolar RNA-associated protein 24